MVAINAPREVVAAVRKQGLPGPDVRGGGAHPDRHRLEERRSLRLFRASVRGGQLSHRHGRRGVAVDARRAVHLGRDDGLPRGPAAAGRRPEGDRRRSRRRGARAVRPRHRAPGPAVVRRRGRVGHPGRRGGRETRARARPSRRPTRTSSGACRPRPIRSIRSSASPRASGPTRSLLEILDVEKDSPAARGGLRTATCSSHSTAFRSPTAKDSPGPWLESAGETRPSSRCAARVRPSPSRCPCAGRPTRPANRLRRAGADPASTSARATFSSVTRPSGTISSRTGRSRSMCSLVSTTSMTSGRSCDSRSSSVVWRTLRAPNPPMPRSTVAPA